MMGGLCKNDIQFVTQGSRDWGQDDARMIQPNILHKTKPNKKKTKNNVIILIYKMTELTHRMIRGQIILIILTKPRPALLSLHGPWPC